MIIHTIIITIVLISVSVRVSSARSYERIHRRSSPGFPVAPGNGTDSFSISSAINGSHGYLDVSVDRLREDLRDYFSDIRDTFAGNGYKETARKLIIDRFQHLHYDTWTHNFTANEMRFMVTIRSDITSVSRTD